MIKSCLKSNQPTPVGSPGPEACGPNSTACKQKCVAFCPNAGEVWEADDWDRTPTEPVRNLSYQDILELKEIQKSLPRAQQPIDLRAARPFANQYLSKVPVGLLPLLPNNDPPPVSPPSSSDINSSSINTTCASGYKDGYHEQEETKSPPVTYSAPSALFPRGFAMKQEKPPSTPNAPPPSLFSRPSPPSSTQPPTSYPPPPSSSQSYFGSHHTQLPPSQPPTYPPFQRRDASATVPTHLAHLSPPPSRPVQTPQPRKQSTFTFLPLFDVPPTPKVEEDPPTPSLTNASLDSSPNPSPRSQASDLPDTPLSDSHHHHYTQSSYFPAIEDGGESKILPPIVSFKRMDITASLSRPPPHSASSSASGSPLSSFQNSPTEQHRHVHHVHDSEHVDVLPEEVKPRQMKPKKKKQVIYINDMEVELDEDEEDEEPQSSPVPPSSSPSSTSSPNSPNSFSPVSPSPSTPPRLIRGFQFLPVNACPGGDSTGNAISGSGSPPTPVPSPLSSRMGCAPLSMRAGSSPPSGNVGFVKSS